MNRATYNITDDRFKFWPAERLSPSDYAEAKACKFQWFPGQKCFSAIWRPQAEDFLARLGVEIEDVCEVDDVAARVERFDRYAAKPSSQPKGTQQARDGKTPELFGAFGAEGGFVDRLEHCTWYLITKVNRSTVEYLSKCQVQRADRSTYWQYYIKKTEIRGLSFVKSPAEVKTAHPGLLADWAAVEELNAKAEAKKVARLAAFEGMPAGVRASFYELADAYKRPVEDVFAVWYSWSGGDFSKTVAEFKAHLDGKGSVDA